MSVDYFYSEPNAKVKLKSVEYRKFITKVSKTQQDSIEERARAIFERYFELEDILRINEKPEYFTCKKIICSGGHAEEAARNLRNQWELGYDPVPDLVKMLEDKGYKAIEIEAPVGFDGVKGNY